MVSKKHPFIVVGAAAAIAVSVVIAAPSTSSDRTEPDRAVAVSGAPVPAIPFGAGAARRSSIIAENMTMEQVKGIIRDNNERISELIGYKERTEKALKEKEHALESCTEALRQQKTVNPYNKAPWYDPFAIYEAKQEKDAEIERLVREEQKLEQEVLSHKAAIETANAEQERIQDEIQKLYDGIAEANPSISIEEISSQMDVEYIEQIKAEKIDRFIEEYREYVEIPSDTSQSMQQEFIMPVSDYIVTSEFGYRVHPIYGTEKFHSGVDLGVDYGDTVYASGLGRVVYSGWYSGFGYTVILSHAEGSYTLYGHNQELLVDEGDIVVLGQPIALAGSSGNSTGPHVHFSMWMNDELVDPMEYISQF